MGDEVIGKIIENSIVAGAFIYMLRFQTVGIAGTLKEISVNMKSFADSLKDVSSTLLKIDVRVEQLEKRVEDFEKGVN